MRQGGYRSLCDYAVIGDGRTAALVALDGSIDWLCLPNFDSPSIFGAILDPVRGGAFHLQPSVPFSASRRYLQGSNVLETTFSTARGCVRVVDAITIPDAALAPLRELARVVKGMEGAVPMEWSASPRFAYGASSGKTGWRGHVPVATRGRDAIALMSWGTGSPSWTNGAVGSSWTVEEGQRSILALVAAYGDPMMSPSVRSGSARR